MEQPIIVACDFNVLSRNADTGRIIEHALKSAKHIFSCLNWKSLLALPATIKYMQQRGIEIAQTNPGITNTIKTLFAELEKEGYGKFTDTAITCFNEMGINPVVDQESLTLLHQLRTLNIPLIGVGIQDSLEHEIYYRKMLAEHKIDIYELYRGIITIPTLDEQIRFQGTTADYLIRRQQDPCWFVTRHTPRSQAFTHNLTVMAHELAGEATLWSANTKEELQGIIQVLHRIVARHSPSLETATELEAGIDVPPVILSPTRV
jgi:hypothetical protein